MGFSEAIDACAAILERERKRVDAISPKAKDRRVQLHHVSEEYELIRREILELKNQPVQNEPKT